ncbi:MAG: heme-binding protein, partial [Bacteroidota bacterium]
LEAAMKIGAEAKKYAEANNAPGGAIAIVDAGGNLIYLIRLTGTFPAASKVSEGKARTAALFRFPSKKLEDAVIGGRTSLNTTGFNLLRGGIPIMYKGKVVGGIGVSGAASADQDVEIAEAGAKVIFD